ncbi:hypothetical protein QQ045_025619 [Rhodiola kirilowii]
MVNLECITKQTTEQLYRKVDGVWMEAESAAKKVSANVKEKLSDAAEENRQVAQLTLMEKAIQHLRIPKNQQAGFSDNAGNVFGIFRTAASVASSKLSSGYQTWKETKVVDVAKKGYDIVKDELTGKPNMRKHIQHDIPSPSTVERSTRTDIVIVPSNQSRLSKKWEALKDKMRNHPMFKRVSEPVVTKSQEVNSDLYLYLWILGETSDHPIVHKIQDINESIFGEAHTAISFKEIRRRDPNFSLPDFVAEVQEVIKPVLLAYMKGDAETLKKYCSSEVIERCKAYQSQGMFFDNKILHISEIEVRETKMMGSSPIIIVGDTIHTVYYAWAMQQVDPEELGEGAFFPIWRLREMQQLGVQALI